MIFHERVFNITIMNVIIVVGVEISSRDGSLFIGLSVILCLDLVMKAPCRNISAALLDGSESEGRRWWVQLDKFIGLG